GGAILPVPDRPLPPRGQRVQPLDAATALNLAPAAQALRALILTHPRLRSHRFIAAARSPDRSDLFFGTDGMGLVRVDAATAEWENLSYGLLSPRAGAVTLAPGGVWVASAGRVGERHGVAWVAADLSADTTVEGSDPLGFGCVAGRRLLAAGRWLWRACGRGVVRVAIGSYGSPRFTPRFSPSLSRGTRSSPSRRTSSRGAIPRRGPGPWFTSAPSWVR